MAVALHKAGGLAGWLFRALQNQPKPKPSLNLLERISIAPRQSLVLIEAEGRRFLIATSAEGTPVFHPLNHVVDRRPMGSQKRISW
jgi:flagellar biogenesis protein FliO